MRASDEYAEKLRWMEARELDAEVAEKVMGWQEVDNMWLNYKNQVFANYPDWSPSTDIGAAWEVAEKMIADGWHLHLEHEQGWWCLLFRYGDPELPEELEEASADTEKSERAICIAACLAVFGESTPPPPTA